MQTNSMMYRIKCSPPIPTSLLHYLFVLKIFLWSLPNVPWSLKAMKN